MPAGAWLKRGSAALLCLCQCLCLCHCRGPLPRGAAPERPAPPPADAALPSPPVAEPPLETLEQVRRRLLDEQDTDCDQKITVHDQGSRRFRFRLRDQPYELTGGYGLSNLLEELTFGVYAGLEPRLERLLEDPISRVARVLGSEAWDALTRRVDEDGLPRILEDPSLHRHPERALYVPSSDRRALDYFAGVAQRYNAAYRQLARGAMQLPLLGSLSDASAEERSQALVGLLRTPEGRQRLAELIGRLSENLDRLGHAALSRDLGRALTRVRELLFRAELPCVQQSESRLARVALGLVQQFARFRPRELRVHALPSPPRSAEPGPPSPVGSLPPGPLSLGLQVRAGAAPSGIPFIAPSGAAEQMNGWASYFILLGLLEDGRRELARGLVDNAVYAVEHYGALSSANRSDYLGRAQPPFLTSMIRALWQATPPAERDPSWLRRALDAARSEYEQVWTRPPRRVTSLCRGEGAERVCLSRYAGAGSGPAPEPEAGHFEALWQELGRSLQASYARGQLGTRDLDAELASAFRHDGCTRESGHEDTYRWFWPAQTTRGATGPVNRCADMVPVDLNSLLYKYEVDLGHLFAELAALEAPPGKAAPLERARDARSWCARARQRFALLKEHLWSTREGLFQDAVVDLAVAPAPVLTGYVSATTLYPLWASSEPCGASEDAGRGELPPLSRQEKSALVTNALAQLEAPGGLLASARRSRERFPARPDRAWDYPNGWAPHQMLAWRALEAHGFHEDAQRLAFSWLYLLLTQVIDADAGMLEHYDVVQRSGVLGTDRDLVDTELGALASTGVAWTNASFQVGLALLDAPERARLARAVAR